MPRNISFSMTTPQFIDGSKDVTRRFGWWDLKPGDVLCAVEKAMGLKKGEKIKRLGLIRVVSVNLEALNMMALNWDYGMKELKREGYPFGCKNPREFVKILARESGKPLTALVNRIEFERINDA